MHITRFADAPIYAAPGHYGILGKRLQGLEAGPSRQLWLGVSIIAPGGSITASASRYEKIYLLLEGEVEIAGGEGEPVTLHPWDSARIAPDEVRSVENKSAANAVLALSMALHAPAEVG